MKQSMSGAKLRKQTVTSAASKIATGAVSSAGILLASQLLYVSITRPALNIPDQSTEASFKEDGQLVEVECENGSKHVERQPSEADDREKDEIRVVFIGDSTVEGLGCSTQDMTIGGQTAISMAHMFRKPVRYWLLGKSGSTAGEIEKEMIPILRNISQKFRIDLVVISCGTNNLLWGHSTTAFGNQFELLLTGIENCRIGYGVPIIVLGFFKLETIPLLPFPLSSVLGLRSTSYQKKMEDIIERRSSYRTMAVVNCPRVERLDNCPDDPFLKNISKEKRKNLRVGDFFADDGFHPGRFGPVILGNQISQTYKEITYFVQDKRDDKTVRNQLSKSDTDTTDEESRDDLTS